MVGLRLWARIMNGATCADIHFPRLLFPNAD